MGSDGFLKRVVRDAEVGDFYADRGNMMRRFGIRSRRTRVVATRIASLTKL